MSAPQPEGAPQVLVLGGGAVVRECFAPALATLGLLSRTTIVDPHASSATYREPVRIVQEDFREVLKNAAGSGLTHCVVALPNALHHEAVDLALRSGLHVLCEKPLSLRASECTALADVADREHRTLAVNMVRRLYHSVRCAVTVIARGWIGDVRDVRIAHGGKYGWPAASIAPFERANGGVLADMGVHYLDLVEMFVGPVEPVSYHDDWAGGVESDCEFRLHTSTGATVNIALSRTRPLANEIEIIGTRGQIRIGVDTFDECTVEPLEATGGEALRVRAADGDHQRFEDYFAEQMRRFLGEAGGEDLVDGRAAARATALIEWAYAQRGAQVTTTSSAARLEPGGAFVTGATGFIGAHLVERLTVDGRTDITAGYHSLRGCARISRFPVRLAGTDLLNPDQVRAVVRGQRYVFHLAVGKAEGEEQAITVQGTKNVVEAAIAEGAEAVVVLSTMYVVGRPGGTVDETAPYRPIGGLYGTTKAEMERWCLERARSSSTRIVVLLPTCVYGEGGGTYTEMPVEMARDGRFCWIEDGAGLANIIYAANLADAMIRAATTTAAHGQRFIVNDEILTWRDFLSPLLGKWADMVPSPTAEEFRAMLVSPPSPGMRDVIGAVVRSREVWDTVGRTGMANVLRPVIKKHLPSVSRLRAKASFSGDRVAAPVRPMPPEWLAEVYGPTSTRFSSDRARQVLGWKPDVALDVAIGRTVHWLREQGLYK